MTRAKWKELAERMQPGDFVRVYTGSEGRSLGKWLTEAGKLWSSYRNYQVKHGNHFIVFVGEWPKQEIEVEPPR